MRTSAGYLFMDYIKPSLTWPEHLAVLEQQGLLLPPLPTHYLSLVSFHRLSPYFGVHYQPKEQYFLVGTTFNQVWQLYEFNRELRLLVSDAIERIEIICIVALASGFFWLPRNR